MKRHYVWGRSRLYLLENRPRSLLAVGRGIRIESISIYRNTWNDPLESDATMEFGHFKGDEELNAVNNNFYGVLNKVLHT